MKHNLELPSNMQLVTPQAVTTSNNSHNSMGSPWRSLSKLRSNAHTEHRVTAPLSSCSMLRDHVNGGGGGSSACRGAASGGSSSVFGLTRPFSNGGGPQWAKLPKIRFRKTCEIDCSSLYACNNLTDFYMKIQSLETATMSNLLKLVWKSS